MLRQCDLGVTWRGVACRGPEFSKRRDVEAGGFTGDSSGPRGEPNGQRQIQNLRTSKRKTSFKEDLEMTDMRNGIILNI